MGKKSSLREKIARINEEKDGKFWNCEERYLMNEEKKTFEEEEKDLEARKEYSDIEGFEDSVESLPDDYEYSLTSFGVDFTVSGLVKKLRDRDIRIPKYQREYVWNKPRASRFIESLLLGLPVPGVFLSKDEDEVYWVVDGMQRLKALEFFCAGDDEGKHFLKLTGVKAKFQNKSYENLDRVDKRRLDDSIIHSTIIRPDDPKGRNNQSVFLIFERLNTGGVVLSAQEIRNCVYSRGENTLLSKINKVANQKYFIDFVGVKTLRKKHEEICLRLFSLAYNWNEYSNSNMKRFLNNFLDNNSNIEVDDKKFEKIIDFIKSNLAKEVGVGKRINLPFLDAVFVGCYLNYEKLENPNLTSEIQVALKSEGFSEYTKTGTSHNPNSMKGRIKLINERIKGLSNEEKRY